jgi:hypothetical protein
MTVSPSTDESRDLTIFTVKGELAFEVQMNTLKAFYNGEPTANVLWDFRLMEGNRLSSKELEVLFALIKNNQGKRPKGKTALVSATDLDFGLSRVSETLCHVQNLPWEIRAFRSMDDALKWIDGDSQIPF